MREISERIRAMRDALGLTQTQLGRYAGVSKQAVSGWEGGKAAPQRDALHNLRRNLGINDAWIMRGEGAMLLAHPDADTLTAECAETPAAYSLRGMGDAVLSEALDGFARAAQDGRLAPAARQIIVSLWEIARRGDASR